MPQRLLGCLIFLVVAGQSLLASESDQTPVPWTITSRPPLVEGALTGTWRVIKGEGNAKAVAALPREIRFDSELIDQLPAEGNFKGLDFRSADGSVVRAIYRFSGSTLIVSQSPPDRPRPKGFHAGEVICVWSAERQ